MPCGEQQRSEKTGGAFLDSKSSIEEKAGFAGIIECEMERGDAMPIPMMDVGTAREQGIQITGFAETCRNHQRRQTARVLRFEFRAPRVPCVCQQRRSKPGNFFGRERRTPDENEEIKYSNAEDAVCGTEADDDCHLAPRRAE